MLRRLLRRAAVKMYQLNMELSDISKLITPLMKPYTGIYFENANVTDIESVIKDEMSRFSKTLERGMKEVEKQKTITGVTAFDLFQSYGFPFELTQELAQDRGIVVSKDEFEKAQELHRTSSRNASVGKFKGGLADSSDQVVKYHTATHLLQQALKDVFGDMIRQEGSNITSERLRFDTRLDHKPTEDELQKVQEIINQKISQALPCLLYTSKNTQNLKELESYQKIPAISSQIFFLTILLDSQHLDHNQIW